MRERILRLERELSEARRELATLESGASHGGEAASIGGAPAVTATSSTVDKIALFRSRFAGRDDAYALPWVSRRTGKKGWSPAVRGGFFTDQTRDADLLPLTDSVIEHHLRGDPAGGRDFHVGLYPMLREDRCKLLACDFDDGEWRGDAAAFVAACEASGVPALAEISRSGAGAHVWIFFEEPLPAVTARAMGAALLRSAMAGRATISMSSYDRFFPSQDTLPSRSPGRFRLGNLIALPLQGDCRRADTAIFADPGTWRPLQDQFGALSACTPVSVERALELAGSSARPYAGPREKLPRRPRRSAIRAESVAVAGRRVTLGRGAAISIPTGDLPGPVIAELKHMASVANPEYYRRQAQRFSTFGVPRLVTCFEHDEGELRIPRGLLDEATGLLHEAGFEVDVRDDVASVDTVELTFTGELRPEQVEAVDEILRHDTGVLVAPPGAGKTVIACALIAKRSVPTAILVNRADLLQQWRTRLVEYLSITDKEIGQLGGGRRKRKGAVDLIMMQSIAHRAGDPSVLEDYGQVIIDECHAIAAPAVEAAIREVSVRYWAGLTATPYRADQMDGLITMQAGPIRHTIVPGDVSDREFIVHETAFATAESGSDGPSIQAIYSELAADEARNAQIVDQIVRAADRGRRSLVLTNRLDHLEALASSTESRTTVPVIRLHGRLPVPERRAVRERLRSLDASRDPFVLIAIDKVAGEGIDLPSLNTLFLAVPVSFKGRIIQQIGRVTRGVDSGDVPTVHDFRDAAVPWLERMHNRRRRVIAKEGFSISSERG
jgi:superfamily II DNA or RNA helicase